MNHKSNKINKFLLEQEAALNSSLEEKWWPFNKRKEEAEEDKEQKSKFSVSALQDRQNAVFIKNNLKKNVSLTMQALMLKLIKMGKVTEIVRPPQGQEEHLGTFLIRKMDPDNKPPPYQQLREPNDYAKLKNYFNAWAESYMDRAYKKDFFIKIASELVPVGRRRPLFLKNKVPNPRFAEAQEQVMSDVERLVDKAMAELMLNRGDVEAAGEIAMPPKAKVTYRALVGTDEPISTILMHFVGVLTSEEKESLIDFLNAKLNDFKKPKSEPEKFDPGSYKLEEAESARDTSWMDGPPPDADDIARIKIFLTTVNELWPTADHRRVAGKPEHLKFFRDEVLPEIARKLGEEVPDYASGSDSVPDLAALLATNSLEEFGKIYAQMIKSDPREHPPFEDLVGLARIHAQKGDLQILGSGVPADPTQAIARFGDPEGRSRSKFIELVKAELTGGGGKAPTEEQTEAAKKILTAFSGLSDIDGQEALDDAINDLEVTDNGVAALRMVANKIESSSKEEDFNEFQLEIWETLKLYADSNADPDEEPTENPDEEPTEKLGAPDKGYDYDIDAGLDESFRRMNKLAGLIK